MAQTDEGVEAAKNTELPRVLSLRDATMLVVSSVIGVGIFLTPGGVAKLLPHPAWFAAAWLAGGVLALAGALANAELGAMFPRAGGNYVYLRAAYHPMAGFLVGWLSFFGIFAGTVATLALGFTISLSSFIDVSPNGALALAIVLIWVATAVNAYATRAGATLNTVTAYLKIAALVAVVVLGPIFGHARVTAQPFASTGSVALGDFGAALSPVIFSYLGWNASVYVAGEIDKPGRNLPRSLFWGLGICTAIYLLVTTTFVYAVGMPALSAGSDGMPAVGPVAGGVLFGAVGGKLVAAIMLVSIFGCLNANVLVGPRIAYAMARDGLFFRVAASLSVRAKTPWLAVIVQAVMASALVLIARGEMNKVLQYTTFAILLATIADTGALYVLRFRDPARSRPYRAAGYPWVPALYILANVAIAVSLVRTRPEECLKSLGVLLAGVPVYLLFASRARRKA
jgi:APA family basic amino acid/polyamine antiporter